VPELLADEPSRSASAVLATLSPSLRALAERGARKRYRKSTLLIEEGSQGDTLYLLLAGRVRAFAADSRGREVTYGVYGAGEYVGEMSLDGGPRSASVITLEPCDCVVITRTTLERFIAEQPTFAFELLAKVIRRARAATLSARQMALNDVYGRLKQQLEGAAQWRADGTGQLQERLTHQELAGRLGCSREMVSRLMKDLENGGHLTRVDGLLVLAKPLPQRW
jgi:CRP/FNR family cyclic AMP-dependent transcriptional regulator